MSNPLVLAAVTAVLIGSSAFFVAVEFALLAAKRHRLEDAAATSRSARAALRSSTELTLLLAGCQLGITACTLALGAVTKPAVHHWLTPLLESWGTPPWTADVSGFALALIVVTFLHLVVGEMAPKSWAIAHPEASATLLAIPMRGFMWLTRPVLGTLNEMANWCLRRVGVEPADQVATGQSPDDLRHLVEHSANVGALDASYSTQLGTALALQSLTVGDLLRPDARPAAVAADASVAEVQEAARTSGHLRILITSSGSSSPATRPRNPSNSGSEPSQGSRTGVLGGGTVAGVVHVRDTLTELPDQPAAQYMRPVFTLEHDSPVYAALASMRETRNHLAVITHDDVFTGVITLADILGRLFPRTAGSTGS